MLTSGAIGDQVGGICFAMNIIAAVAARERTGKGQMMQTSQLGAMMTYQHIGMSLFFTYGKQNSPGPSVAGSSTMSWFRGSDEKWFTAAMAVEDKHWLRFCGAIGREDLLKDERSNSRVARIRNSQWLNDTIQSTIAGRPRDHWVKNIVEADVPCAPINDYEDVVSSQHFWDNGYLHEMDTPSKLTGQTKAPGVAARFSETPMQVQGPAPTLGEHTEETLARIGFSADEIRELAADGATAPPQRQPKPRL